VAVTVSVAETEPLEGTWILVGLTVTGGPPVEGKADRATDPENPFTLESVTISNALDP
jgi:hypothetical protein